MRKTVSGRCWLLPVCVAAWVCTSCDRVGYRDARERESQVLARAYSLLDAGDFAGSALAFRRALHTNPMLARPHLDFAMLLHDQRQDLVRAIYHYERYLELRPSTEKAEMIQGRMDAARDALVASYRRTMVDTPEVPVDPGGLPAVPVAASTGAVADVTATASAELVQVREERNRLRVSLAEQERVLDARQARIQELEGRVRVLEGALAQARAMVPVLGPAEVGGAPVTQQVAGTFESGVRTYEVRSNDSLSVIAHKVYGDATKWRLIQVANREVLGDSEMLRIGQVLVIPEIGE